MNKTELEGELFTIVEQDEEVVICAEVNGFNIWDWLSQNHGNKVRIILERLK